MALTGKSVGLVLLAAVGVAAYAFWSADTKREENPISVAMAAQLTAAQRAGESSFETHCVACHGVLGAGTEQGPPLIHRIYEPSHHADGAFHLAARNGVRAHHWPFGDMPAVPDVSEPEMVNIIAYVRAIQRANGIQ